MFSVEYFPHPDLILSLGTCLERFCSLDVSRSPLVFFKREILTPIVKTSTYTTTGLPTPSHSGETTLSYVIGTGLSTTTVVTTIRRTSYKTKYNVSIFVFNSIPTSASNLCYFQTVYTSAKGGENGASSPPGYQTVRKTIQSTKYVYAGPTAAGRPAGSIEGGALDLVVCPAPVTVTVGQTITVVSLLKL